MRPSLVSPSLFLLTAFATTGTALQALTSSPCAVQCGNVLGGTSANDIVCPDSSYNTTSAGQTFQSCTTCQLASKYQDPVTQQTDLQWALYNIRYAMSFCLFGYNNPEEFSNQCNINVACGPYENSFEYMDLDPSVGAYDYCPSFLNASTFTGTSYAKCSGCLPEDDAQYYLSNFFTVLDAACIQKPASNSTISIKGSVFSTQMVNITMPKNQGAYVPSTGLSLGAKVGIAIGCIIFALLVGGFCIIWNGKRRRRATLRQRQRDSGFGEDWAKHQDFAASQQYFGGNPGMAHATPPMNQGQFFDSPDSQRPLAHQLPWANRRAEDESPASAMGEKVYFSPYTSQYNSPVSAHDHLPSIARDWPTVERKGSVQEMPAGADKKGKDKLEREQEREQEQAAIELQNVTPMLQHPGNGRPVSGVQPEGDVKKDATV